MSLYQAVEQRVQVVQGEEAVHALVNSLGDLVLLGRGLGLVVVGQVLGSGQGLGVLSVTTLEKNFIKNRLQSILGPLP